MSLKRMAAVMAAAGLLACGGGVPAWSQQRAVPRPAAPVPQCDAAKFRVIVDVGHTPEIPGAISARGATEYDFNLRLAKVVERKLNDAGYARTSLLLATGPAIPSLVRRIAQANQMSADLLISIHHDSVPQVFKVKWEYEGKPLEYRDRFQSSLHSGGNDEHFIFDDRAQ
jgi:N-acetylmuramoyl-L-alanine amidase